MSDGLSLNNPIFRSFTGYAAVVLLKTLIMSLLTARHRMGKKVFANEEDATFHNVAKIGPVFGDPDVERVRRAHRNDLENIIPFVLLGFLYTCTGPDLSLALLHFRIFTATRIIHTIVYLFKVPQPSRALTFFIGMFVNMSFVFQIIKQASF